MIYNGPKDYQEEDEELLPEDFELFPNEEFEGQDPDYPPYDD